MHIVFGKASAWVHERLRESLQQTLGNLRVTLYFNMQHDEFLIFHKGIALLDIRNDGTVVLSLKLFRENHGSDTQQICARAKARFAAQDHVSRA